MATDHDLRRRVEVRGTDDFAGGRLNARRRDIIIGEPEDRGHRTDADGHRVLHRRGAEAHEPHGVLKVEHAGGGQGGVFA